MEDFFKIDTGKMIKAAIKDKTADESVLRRWLSWKLNETEEKALTCLFPADTKDWPGTLNKYEKAITYIRGNDLKSAFWCSGKEVSELKIDKEVLMSEDFKIKFISSFYLWTFGYYPVPAIEMLWKIAKAANDEDLVFDDFDAENGSFYLRATLFLQVRYFAEMTSAWQCHVLNSQKLFLAIETGLDLDVALKDAVHYFVVLEERRKSSLVFATFIRDNNGPVGVKKTGDEQGNIKYWIDLFKLYSKDKFDGLSFVDFFNDKEVWQYCDLFEKMEIKQILTLYLRLVSDYYTIPEGIDSIAFDRNQISQKSDSVDYSVNYSEIKQKIDSVFSKGENGEYKDVSGVLLKLEEMSKERGDEKIMELFFWDEKEGKFKWGI